MEQRVSLAPTEQGLSPSEPAAERRDGVATASGVNFESSTRQIAQRQVLAKLQGSPRQPLQRQAPGGSTSNLTGLPDKLKAGVEALSGMDISAVRVHTNSDKPAQMHAEAYAQGNDIYLGRGQERHLPHEAWHVVQQRQGRVKATMQFAGIGVNDDPRLEHEADTMGTIASRGGVSQLATTSPVSNDSVTGAGVVQRAVGFELEVNIPVSQQTAPADAMPAGLRPAGQDWANARIPFPEADPHGIPPVPQAVIYTATNGGVTVDAVPDKRLLAAGMPRQILEIRVSPIDTANIAGLGATMGHVRTGIDGLYNPINGGAPQNHRFPIPGGIPAMVGLPFGNDPTGTFNDADRAEVTWRTYMQATAGIRTDRVRKLHKKISEGATGADDASLDSLESSTARHQDIADDARTAAQNVYNTVHGVANNPDDGIAIERKSVLGFLTLVCSYLLGGKKAYRGRGNLNPKNMTALFSRTGFNQLRTQTLSANSEAWIRTNAVSFRSALVNATRSADADDRMYSPLFNRLGMAHPTQNVVIFLNDALGGAQDRYTDAESKSIIAPENVGAARPGGVFEFRRISNPGANPGAWVAKIQEVVTAIHHLNN
ncbi:hypothetical protein J2T07_000445 [Luteibacter jiangsuensis]|uniref:eCIS core domain-containing protein n=1 Tax=Luteibacter jiangsuensis TaxID=637577 RepID=A0ABT9SV76_9GAMM|nr:DUF4157 domain-containing protein [Luteibacter jiangsuensis]MDQ0008286.1 hypothetical protein [Luteibacter jiangsuensis]